MSTETNKNTMEEALLAIHLLMDGTEWSADTLEAIAEVLHSAGLPLGEPGGPVGRSACSLPAEEVPTSVRAAIERVVDYLYEDEAADYLETSPLEGRADHVFTVLRRLKLWLDSTRPELRRVTPDGRREP